MKLNFVPRLENAFSGGCKNDIHIGRMLNDRLNRRVVWCHRLHPFLAVLHSVERTAGIFPGDRRS